MSALRNWPPTGPMAPIPRYRAWLKSTLGHAETELKASTSSHCGAQRGPLIMAMRLWSTILGYQFPLSRRHVLVSHCSTRVTGPNVTHGPQLTLLGSHCRQYDTRSPQNCTRNTRPWEGCASRGSLIWLTPVSSSSSSIISFPAMCAAFPPKQRTYEMSKSSPSSLLGSSCLTN